MKLGDPCPDFRLPGTDGKEHTLDEFRGQLLVVVVSCNHCPYVVAYETRMVALARVAESDELRARIEALEAATTKER